MMSELGGYLRAAAEEDWTEQLKKDKFAAAEVQQVRT